MCESPGAHFLRAALKELRQLKALEEKAMAQVKNDEFSATLDPESNSP